jgi:hypothetical protein
MDSIYDQYIPSLYRMRFVYEKLEYALRGGARVIACPFDLSVWFLRITACVVYQPPGHLYWPLNASLDRWLVEPSHSQAQTSII